MRTLLLPFLLVRVAYGQEQSAIGEWRDHFPYSNVTTVAEGGGHIYSASANGAFRYALSNGEIERINKTDLLNDVGIQGLSWNAQEQAMLVFYSNGNLDLVKGSSSYNIGDIKRSSIIGNKGVYSACMQGSLAYLGCGFGIVVADLATREIRDTWFIGPAGAQLQVNSIAMTADSIYAATASGLFSASRSASNLAFYESWRRRTDMGPSLAGGPFNSVAVIGDKILVNAPRSTGGDSLLVLGPEGTWSRFAPLFGKVNRSMSVSADGQVLTIAQSDEVHVYNAGLEQIGYLFDFDGQRLAPNQAITASGGAVWIADRSQGLLRIGGGATRVAPNGPRTASTWRMASAGGDLYVPAGAVTGTWANGYRQEGIHVFMDGRWTTVDRSTSEFMAGENEFTGGIADMLAIAIDPDDARHAFVGSWDEGIVEFRDGLPVDIFNPTNSALGYDINPFQNRLYVGGLDFDEEGNLWISNAWSARPIVVRKKDGSWHSFTPGNLLGGNLLLADVLAASTGTKWILRPRGNGILVYDSGSSIDSPDDDQYRILNNAEGNGGLPAPDVYTLAEDHDGQIWVGTSRGLGVFYDPASVFSGGDFDAQQILIEQDGNVQILLETEAVNSIVVDGANRKWIGTQGSGAFLVSPDGREELRHFTAENSPLPSNTVVNIAVDGSTGEVFIATDRGIMSYRGDAIDGAADSDCSKVFPNPVRETYTGPIAITGLVEDSEVKITDVSGNLVYRTTSLGGQAIWDGNDMSGRRAATGVYLVFASDATGSFKCNTKLLLVK
ncbi:MAG: two-component regulator propeller domain-containing protein [Flavobacteriales bacterium]